LKELNMRNRIVCGSMLVLAFMMIGAEPAKEKKPAAGAAAAAPEMKLPPGWTAEDMQACMMASTPGKKHEQLAQGAGTWQGKQTMWMWEGAEPVKSEVTSKVTAIMDGRYLKTEYTGDVPGMGPYTGFGTTGFDNVSQKVVSTWIDNWTTGILQGVGELSEDGKTITLKYTYNCPVTKKPTVMRQIEKTTGSSSKTLEMFAIDPKSGKEYKMMSVEFTKRDEARARK
jgi:hypothetical protein